MRELLPPLLLMVFNIAALWLLMAAPLGTRTIRRTRRISTTPERLWAIAAPHSDETPHWQHDILSSTLVEGEPGKVEIVYRKPDRHGRSMRRLLSVDPAAPDETGRACRLHIIGDSTLDARFWRNYSETREVRPDGGGAALTISRTDDYRGYGFLLLRYFVMRREMDALQSWAETGRIHTGTRYTGIPVQGALAVFSTLLMWPFFGPDIGGLVMSVMLTLVIVLHELGHMAAYRTFGHRSVHMIFVPLLGGIAIGGRPYRNRFEIAACALMGPGMSAFLVPVVIGLGNIVTTSRTVPGDPGVVWMFLLILGAFNLLNLLPMNRFDGGQVIRQVFTIRRTRLLASFFLTMAILWIGSRVGIPPRALIGGLAVFTLLSMISGAGPAPTDGFMEEMSGGERLMAGFGLYSAISLHGYAVIYACDRLFP